jgi:hypothetical protein
MINKKDIQVIDKVIAIKPVSLVMDYGEFGPNIVAEYS